MRNVTRNLLILLGLAVLLALAAGCGKNELPPPLNTADMDLSVRPGENFFRYANGTWIEKMELPDDRSRYGAFDMVRKKSDEDIKSLIMEVSKDKSAVDGSNAQKIRDFYSLGMDVETINEQGLAPIQKQLNRIDAIETIQDVQDVVAEFHTQGIGPVFGGGVEQDLMNTKNFKFYLMQSGLGLTDVDYYTNPDERSQEIRDTYVKYIAEVLGLMGEDDAQAAAHAQTVMDMEMQLAKASKTRLEMRNIPALYNPMSMKQLKAHAPNVNWDRYFTNLSDIDFGDVIVGMPKFFKEVSVMFGSVPVADWKTYLRWNLVNSLAPFLSEDYVMASYRFYSEFLSGSKQIRPRWERVVAVVSGQLGQPLGQLYVKKHFTPESKARMVEMTANLKKALRMRLENVEWMTDATKEKALAKLETMRLKVGYPDKWEDYSKLEVKTDSYVENVLRANRFHFHKNLKRFTEPPDPDRWGMTPQTVNAGYNPIKNDITFPAGILQPPFFHPEADDAVNYGAIGMVIGHEMTHGFDDQGRLFDKDGNMSGWWTAEDSKEFKKRTQPLIDQYNGFVAVDDVHCNGQLTLGENIADFGGLTLSLLAYKISREGKEPAADIDGLTDLQRFFLANAQVWRGKIRDKALIRQCKEDVHPWGEFRVNGAPFNVPEFYEAFEISPEDPLYIAPEDRPVIW